MHLTSNQEKLIWASLTIAVTAFASIPLALDLSSATPVPAAAEAPDPTASSSPTAAPASGKPTFYLQMQKGRCYAYSPDGTGSFTVKWALSDTKAARNLVNLSCDGPHHIEIIATPTLKVANQDPPDLSTKARRACAAEYLKQFDKGPPGAAAKWMTIDQDEQPPILVLFPTKGPESKRYPGRVVCATYRISGDGTKILSIK